MLFSTSINNIGLSLIWNVFLSDTCTRMKLHIFKYIYTIILNSKYCKINCYLHFCRTFRVAGHIQKEASTHHHQVCFRVEVLIYTLGWTQVVTLRESQPCWHSSGRNGLTDLAWGFCCQSSLMKLHTSKQSST